MEIFVFLKKEKIMRKYLFLLLPTLILFSMTSSCFGIEKEFTFKNSTNYSISIRGVLCGKSFNTENNIATGTERVITLQVDPSKATEFTVLIKNPGDPTLNIAKFKFTYKATKKPKTYFEITEDNIPYIKIDNKFGTRLSLTSPRGRE